MQLLQVDGDRPQVRESQVGMQIGQARRSRPGARAAPRRSGRTRAGGRGLAAKRNARAASGAPVRWADSCERREVDDAAEALVHFRGQCARLGVHRNGVGGFASGCEDAREPVWARSRPRNLRHTVCSREGDKLWSQRPHDACSFSLLSFGGRCDWRRVDPASRRAGRPGESFLPHDEACGASTRIRGASCLETVAESFPARIAAMDSRCKSTPAGVGYHRTARVCGFDD